MGKTIVVVLGLLGWGAIAAADPITVFSDRRESTVLARVEDAGQTDRHTDSQGPGDALSATASASTGFSVAQATASLVSSISDPAHLRGTGHSVAAFSTSGEGQVSATALFEVDLVLDAPFMYAFTGMFEVSDFRTGYSGAFNEARWSAALSSGSSDWFNAAATNPARLDFGGLLPAGSYHFLVGSLANGFSERAATVVEDSGFDFALDLTPSDSSPSPTPEPASLLLLGTGVAGLVTRNSRMRNRDHRLSHRGVPLGAVIGCHTIPVHWRIAGQNPKLS
jgi:hypothetical protein